MKIAAFLLFGIYLCIAWFPFVDAADGVNEVRGYTRTRHRRVRISPRNELLDLDNHDKSNADDQEKELGEFWAERGLMDEFGSMSPLPTESDLIAFWYKPHYQCDGYSETTPQEAANFINEQLVSGDTGADFAGISEWVGANNISIGNPTDYGTVGSVCGYGNTDYTTPVALFYKLDAWTLDDAYPKSQSCNFVPVPPWTGPQIGDICLNKTQPDGDNCCSCTFSDKEYALGNDIGNNLGQRPWVAGVFSKRAKSNESNEKEVKVCVVAGEVTHPLLNSTVYNLNGKLTPDPQPYSIAPYLCTLLNTNECVPNLQNSSILFG